jgi:hypothetical protein
MKKMHYLFGVVLISGMALLNSCSKSSDNTVSDLTPTINFVGGTGFTSGDVTLNIKESFKVGITAFSNASSASKLVKFTVTRVFNNQPFSQDSVINTNSFSITILANANINVGQEAWYFKVTDKDGQTKEISFTITTVVPSGPINTFSMKIMGAQQSSTGSSFASIDGSVYSLADAKTNAAKVDWLYFYGATNFATLAAPDDAAAATIFTDPTNGLQTWAVKNNTRFKLVTDVIDWNSITDDAIIKAQTASGVTNTKINNLAVNNILSFIASSGKLGMIKVESISGTSDGTITISVKVQQ